MLSWTWSRERMRVNILENVAPPQQVSPYVRQTAAWIWCCSILNKVKLWNQIKLHRRKTETEDVVHTQERDREEREKTDMKSRNHLWTHTSVCVCPTIGHNLLVSKSCVLHVRINIQYLSFCIMLFHRMLSSIHFSVMMHLILPYGWVNLSSGWAFRELNCAHIRGFLILLTLCLFCNSAAVNRKTTHLSVCTCVSGAMA